MENETIGELVRRAENDYLQGNTHISKYVDFQMHDTLERIDAYINSKHISGETDSLGRDKPFYNICTAAINIWYRATKIVKKDIKVKPTKAKDWIDAFLATVHLQDWMRREEFDLFLNDWGRTLARYGSSVVKFVENSKGLHISTLPWNRLIVDPVNFEDNPKIEILELTVAQLRKRVKTNGYDSEQVKSLVEAVKQRETLDKQRKDNKTGYIKLYEVHGELPKSHITGNEAAQDEYVQQMHVISFVGIRQGRKTEYLDFTLYSGEEAKDPYMLTHLIKEDGRSLAIGAVEHLFESQWMTNHSMKTIKDTLDLSSRLVFQTADVNFVGRNVLNEIETGDILIHSINSPLTKVDTSKSDIVSIQNYAVSWKQLANEINGISEAMMGANPPSGTAWRQTQALLSESYTLFEDMVKNKSLDIERMMRGWIIPHIKKQMDTSDEVMATLQLNDITKIDATWIKNEAIRLTNKAVVEQILQGQQPTPQDQSALMDKHQGDIQGGLSQMGNQRSFKPDNFSDKTWKEQFKDLEWELEVEVAQVDKANQDVMASLNTALQTIATNPRVLFDPNAKLIFNKLLIASGVVSPIEISDAQPFVIPPNKRFTETLDYKDAPEDIKRQMEAQQGFTPSQQGAQPGAQAQPSPVPAPQPAPIK